MTQPTESDVRSVRDSADLIWHVYVVIEGTKWAGDRTISRQNWLCMESGRDRRFLSPVPKGWKYWSDETLLHWIASAKPDLRGP